MTNGGGWVGVDLDGTLAKYEGWKGHTHIGEPIRPMVERIQQWLAEGKQVKIFTARVSARDDRELHEVVLAIRSWCRKWIGADLPITATKDYAMIELWDDRCVQVIPNTGLRVDEHTTPALGRPSKAEIQRRAIEAYQESRRMGTVTPGEPWEPIAELISKMVAEMGGVSV